MFCSKCGYEVSDGANFCPNCGSGINTHGCVNGAITVIKRQNNEGDGLSILAIVLAFFIPLASLIMSIILKDKYGDKYKKRFNIALIISSIIIIVNIISLLIWSILGGFGILGLMW